jgi:hypothetical protein
MKGEYARCGESRCNGKRCKKPAGWGTDHVGVGKCRFHDKISENIIPLHRWEVYKFAWGAAVKEQRTGRWTNIILSNEQKISVEGLNVVLHDNGIEFI